MPEIYLLTLREDFISCLCRFDHALDRVIQRSAYCAQFSKGQAVELDPGNYSHVKLLCYYPGSGIVAGCLKKRKTKPVYTGPFAEYATDPEWERQIEFLMQNFDWAVFSYNTTHGYENWTFVTTNESLIPILLKGEDKQMLLAHYRGVPPMLPYLKNMTFWGDGAEGLMPYELSRERGEPPPLILTAVEPDTPDTKRRWNFEQEECEPSDWYVEPLSRLEQVSEFSVFKLGRTVLYRLHRVIDFDAYMQLWGECHHEWGIAEAVLSADCDTAALWEALSAMNAVSISRLPESVATWMYSLSYGGAAHEHIGHFVSRDPTITDRAWQMASDRAISRF